MDSQSPAEPSSSSASSISSSHVRQEQIDQLRSRVDSVLRNLVQGTEADTLSLKNQLHSLRGGPTLLSSVSVGSNGTSGSDEFMAPASSTAGTVPIGNTTNSKVFPFLSSSKPSSDKQWIVDPYGDQGEYEGGMNQGRLPHGIGIMKYTDGRVYQGGWKNGQWHGEGRATFSNGDTFEGVYHEDQRHGQGWYKWSDGREFKGGFVNDQRSGHGEYNWPDGARYVGEFQNGLRHGEGTYTVSVMRRVVLRCPHHRGLAMAHHCYHCYISISYYHVLSIIVPRRKRLQRRMATREIPWIRRGERHQVRVPRVVYFIFSPVVAHSVSTCTVHVLPLLVDAVSVIGLMAECTKATGWPEKRLAMVLKFDRMELYDMMVNGRKINRFAVATTIRTRRLTRSRIANHEK
jgi:hypothetical protein